MSAPLSVAKKDGRRRSVLWFVGAVLGAVVIGGLLWIPTAEDTSSAKADTLRGISIRSVGTRPPSGKEAAPSPPIVTSDYSSETSPGEDGSTDPLLTPPAFELQAGKLTWEVRIEALLASHLSDSDKARQLLTQLPLMPIEASSRLAQEAADRIPDRDYTAIALPVLLNPNTNGSAESILYADLLERPDPIALPALLALARNPRHSFAESARETLTLLVGTDFGTDWKQWESAVAGLLANSR